MQYRKSGTGNQGRKIRDRKSGTGNQGREIRDGKSGTGNQGQEGRDRKSGTGNQGQEIGDRKSEDRRYIMIEPAKDKKINDLPRILICDDSIAVQYMKAFPPI